METSLVLVKPDGVQRGLVGRVLSRFEDKGLSIAGLKLLVAPKATLEKHYAVHRERPFYGSLLQFMGSGPVVAIAVRGVNAVSVVRTLLGPTQRVGRIGRARGGDRGDCLAACGLGRHGFHRAGRVVACSDQARREQRRA